MTNGLFAETARCLLLSDAAPKCAAVASLAAAVARGDFSFDEDIAAPPASAPGRPASPLLIDPAKVPRRRLGSAAGRTALVHAVAHIEFNAINLALDAACRFRGMPTAYYSDWISVAADEARHFAMLSGRLQDLGFSYGDFPAHNGLWEMAERTADSCLARMALVPRVLEARGLDVTPGMITRLDQAGDSATARLLEVILAEELRHVAIGSRWFRFCCEREGRDAASTFLDLLRKGHGVTVRGPFNRQARLQAGFTESELLALEALS
jgi:uncharacterized ferritin-like protein (DUF455 family)